MARDNCNSGDSGKNGEVGSREEGMRNAMKAGQHPENMRELEILVHLEDGRVLSYGALCTRGAEATAIRELCADVAEREGSPVRLVVVADTEDIKEAEDEALKELTAGPVKQATIPGRLAGGGM